MAAPERVQLLVFIPHPDDESYAFAATIARATARGAKCHIVCASSGELGERYDGISADPTTLGPAREAELRASCRLLGCDAPEFWRLPDGGLAEVQSQSDHILEAIAAYRPDVILALGADGGYGHPDHLAVYRWVRDTWHGFLASHRPELAWASFPTGLMLPQYDLCISMMGSPPSPARESVGSDSFDVAVPVSELRTTKLESIACHRTQLPEGDPFRLFPPGVVEGVLDRERFVVEPGDSRERGVLESLLR